MTQIARNLTDLNDGFLRGKRYLILDRDTKYSDAFRNVLVREGIHVIRLPPRSPNLNAFSERFVRSIREECLSRMIFLGRASLRHALAQYMSHHHGERNHQGLNNRILRPVANIGKTHDPAKWRNAELLSSSGGLNRPRFISGHYGLRSLSSATGDGFK